MIPLVYNPSWDRTTLWQQSVARIYQACSDWNIIRPEIMEGPPPHARHYGTGGTYYGHWNPDMLLQARPERYAYIARYFPPLHKLSWKEVLANAPDFLIQAIENFCNQGKLKVRCKCPLF